MRIWLFRRRSDRDRCRPNSAGRAGITSMHDSVTGQVPARHDASELTKSSLDRCPERRRCRRATKETFTSTHTPRTRNKLKKNPGRAHRAYSFSPGRHDSLELTQVDHRPPVPPLPVHLKSNRPRASRDAPISVTDATKHSRPILAPLQQEAPADWSGLPSLRRKSAPSFSHRLSRKKRKKERERELKIKAMSASHPIRPATHETFSGRLMKRESTRMQSGLNWQVERHSSDLSLPLPSSLRSLSERLDHQTGYVLSSLDALSPRPTIRYESNPRYAPRVTAYGSDNPESKRRRVMIPEETLKINKRIDDLADSLTASDLRELMERDQRRRDTKRIADMIKTERRLARRQEKQRSEEAAAYRDGKPPPVNMERGVYGRDIIGQELGNSAVVTSSRRRSSVDSQNGRTLNSDSFLPEKPASPLEQYHRQVTHRRNDALSEASKMSEPVTQTENVLGAANAHVSVSPTSRTHTQTMASLYRMLDLGKSKASKSAPAAPAPASPIMTLEGHRPESTDKPPQSWTSFFKLRSRKKQVKTPSSFSNKSQDARTAVTLTPISHTAPMKIPSHVPKRTMSRFREDLPELPISSSDSIEQSPEADYVPPMRKMAESAPVDHRMRYDTPTSGYRSLETNHRRDGTPTSSYRIIDAPSPEPLNALSQSLASIDSEGSWLSGGKGGSRRSSQKVPLAFNGSSNSLSQRDGLWGSFEELGAAEEENSHLEGPSAERRTRRRTSDERCGADISTISVKGTKWGAIAKHGTLVNPEGYTNSREVILGDFEDGFDEMADQRFTRADRKSYLGQDRESEVQRLPVSNSGNWHNRHLSNGSARISELRRVSGDSKRLSADTKRLSAGSMGLSSAGSGVAFI